MDTVTNQQAPPEVLSGEDIGLRVICRELWDSLPPEMQLEIAAGKHADTHWAWAYLQLSILDAQEYCFTRACTEVATGQTILKRH